MSNRAISRVVIACDPASEHRSSIEAAARLAAWLDAALRGVFVEDEALLHLAAMPFGRQVGVSGESFDSVDERAVLHQFEALASRARATLESVAHRHELAWSFDVVRGPLALSTLAIGDRDLLVIEAQSRPISRGVGLTSRWLAAALQGSQPILLLRDGGGTIREIVAFVQTKDSAASQLINTTAHLAMAANRPLVLSLGDNIVGRQAALSVVRSVSEKLADHCRVEVVPTENPPTIAPSGRLLVVDASPAVNNAAALADIAATNRAHILFWR